MLSELISKIRDRRAHDMKIEVNGIYMNRIGEEIRIVRRTDSSDPGHWHGYEWVDQYGRTYMPNGRFTRRSDDRRDLVNIVHRD